MRAELEDAPVLSKDKRTHTHTYTCTPLVETPPVIRVRSVLHAGWSSSVGHYRYILPRVTFCLVSAFNDPCQTALPAYVDPSLSLSPAYEND